MKIRLRLFVSVLLGVQLVLFSCKKKDTTPTTEEVPLEFVSLEASKTVVKSNEQTIITATARGTNLQYSWVASSGAITGSGYQVKFYGSACCATTIEIKCTITDAYKHSDTKSVTITIQD